MPRINLDLALVLASYAAFIGVLAKVWLQGVTVEAPTKRKAR